MSTGKYIPPQKRGGFPNVEATKSISMTLSHKKKNLGKYKAKSDWLLKDTLQEITSFDVARLETRSNIVKSDTDVELLCTYNWISSKPSAICVPGAPPAWTPKDLPVTLPMDYGLYCPQQATYKTPEYPYEPLYQALSIMGPETDFKSTDLVTSRRCLQMLFQVAAGIPFQDFRLELHMVHDTLFLTRREQKTDFVANAHGTNKVGSNFDAAFTTLESGLEDSSSHHRVIRYSLGDLKCVVRFKANACCEEKKNSQVLDKRCVDFFSTPREEDMRMKFEQISSIKREGAADKSQRTSAMLGGRIVGSSSMAELKTYQGENFRIEKHLPQLWFGRTPNLLVGTHKNGTFHKLEAIDAASHFVDWETKHQVELRKLTWLIAGLREATRRTPGECCILVGRGKTRKATVYAGVKRTSVLPESIVKQFWR